MSWLTTVRTYILLWMNRMNSTKKIKKYVYIVETAQIIMYLDNSANTNCCVSMLTMNTFILLTDTCPWTL